MEVTMQDGSRRNARLTCDTASGAWKIRAPRADGTIEYFNGADIEADVVRITQTSPMEWESLGRIGWQPHR